jgi:hypothetical protein
MWCYGMVPHRRVNGVVRKTSFGVVYYANIIIMSLLVKKLTGTHNHAVNHCMTNRYGMISESQQVLNGEW